MKKILFLLLLIPTFVFATQEYGVGKNTANSYYNELELFGNHIRVSTTNSMPYYYGDNKRVANYNGFNTGGFLSEYEYKITTKNKLGNTVGSYLAPGVEYWLYDGDKLDTTLITGQNRQGKSGVRVTEYVKHDSKAEGTGTYTNPWEFDSTIYVTFDSENKSKCHFNGTRTEVLAIGQKAQRDYVINSGYHKTELVCYGLSKKEGTKEKFEDSGSVAAITEVQGNINCWLRCEPNTFTVAYNPDKGTGSIDSHNCTYDGPCNLKDSTGYSRKGYRFIGWKKENAGTTLNAGASVKNATTDNNKTITYYAQWAQNIVVTAAATTSKVSKYNDDLVYKISVKNEGDHAETVKLIDVGLKEELGKGNIAKADNSGNINDMLGDGYSLTINGGQTVEFLLKVKATALAGSVIKERIKYVLEGYTEYTKENETKVETTVYFTKKSDRGVGANVVIIIDQSYSLSATDFKYEKEAVKNFLSFTFTPTSNSNNTQVSVISFAASAVVVGNRATDYSTSEALKTAVGKIPNVYGTSYHVPLIKAYELLYGNGGMAQERPNNINVLIFVSDGQDCGNITERNKYIGYFVTNKTKMYSIGYNIKSGSSSHGHIKAVANNEEGHSFLATTGDIGNMFENLYYMINSQTTDCVTNNGVCANSANLKIDANHMIELSIGSDTYNYSSFSALNSANKGVTYDNSAKKFTVDARKVNKSKEIQITCFVTE